jgi:hypothetical protein
MTLTRIIPSLRLSIPDPLAPDLWPEGTGATVADVVVSGISLVRLAEVYGTPCVHTGASVIPHTGGRPSATRETTVVVVRITRVERTGSGDLVVATDGVIYPTALVMSELRLVGRASTAHLARVRLTRGGVPDGADVGAETELVSDLRVGDLLAAPCHAVETTWTQRLRDAGEETIGRARAHEDAVVHQPAWLSKLS